MSALGFIEEIFSRPQQHVAGNVRFITQRQFDKLRELIAEDPERKSTKSDLNGGLVWMPTGRWHYALSVEQRGAKMVRSLKRMAAEAADPMGTLFG